MRLFDGTRSIHQRAPSSTNLSQSGPRHCVCKYRRLLGAPKKGWLYERTEWQFCRTRQALEDFRNLIARVTTRARNCTALCDAARSHEPLVPKRADRFAQGAACEKMPVTRDYAARLRFSHERC
jgi:hypothetical protein